MNFERKIATMLAEHIHAFISFVNQNYENRHKTYVENPDRIYQIKLLVEEYKFQTLATELERINEFDWNEKYTLILIDRFMKGLQIIEEYVNNYYQDLFILTARIYTLKDLCSSL